MIEFQTISDQDLLKATLMNRARLNENGCWEWTRGKGAGGYGIFSRTNNDRYAHRVAYEAFVGPIPKGLVLRHSCDNPICINPNHLTPGTMKENAQDRESRGRRKCYGEIVGTSKLTETDVLEIKCSFEKPAVLSEKYGVNPSHVWAIKNGKSWKHLHQVTYQ